MVEARPSNDIVLLEQTDLTRRAEAMQACMHFQLLQHHRRMLCKFAASRLHIYSALCTLSETSHVVIPFETIVAPGDEQV